MHRAKQSCAIKTPLISSVQSNDLCRDQPTINRTASKLGSQLLLLLSLLLGAGSFAQAGVFCSEYPGGVIDGDLIAPADMPTAITIDTDCTFQNFPLSNPFKATINFQTNDTNIYLIIFDNVALDGNMACSNVTHNIWFVNAPPSSDVSNSCQDLLIPTESIRKQAPASTASIGVPFTYTLTLPSMQFPIGDPSPNTLAKVILWDDISAAATGADLTYVDINAYYKDTLTPVTLVPQTDPLAKGGVWTPKNLSYEPIASITSGEQIMVDITVVLDDTPLNAAGTPFINTANWWFGRLIDGVAYDPLPGEAGISELMTITEPELIVTKTSDTTALNIGITANFTIDVQNIGGSDAWNTTIVDKLPDGPTAGMCDTDPTATVSAQMFAADGTSAVTPLLTQGVHYSVTYSAAPTCQISFTALSPFAKIGPSQHLIIKYQSLLDADTIGDGIALANIAGATEWFSADGSYPTRSYNKTLTDGTPLLVDHQDSNVITTALSGYYFQKTVSNLTSGASPAVTAAPGDRLRYRLRLFNVDQDFTGITISDLLDPTLFNTATYTMPSYTANYIDSFNQVTGQLDISGFGTPLDLVPGSELVIEFEINLSSSLSNGDVVPNQATLSADATVPFNSDDPFLDGIAAPGFEGDPTNILIQAPGPLSKVNTQTSASVGEQFTYTITVPATAINAPLYDVRILDDLTVSNADMQFVSANVVSDGTWTLTNTGTATNLVIEDTITGIDIPANAQAVIEVTVELLNTSTNISGLSFVNLADYSYNRSNGANTTQTAGESDLSDPMNVTEPALASITKIVSNSTPTAGEIVRYSVALTASAGANLSDVFDVTLTDSLGAGLVYAGNPTVSIGAGVSADNTILDPIITGDGIATEQTLVWGFDSGNADIDIVAGTAVTISYDVLLLDSVLANQTLTNSAAAQWSSVDGVAASERDGSDGLGLLNDYTTDPVIETVTTPDIIATIIKDRSSDTFGAADTNVRIGDLVDYSLTISIPEGTLGNLQIVDTLPQGLAFEGVVSINGNTGPAPYIAAAPFSHADITAANVVLTGDPELVASTVSWTMGNVSNLPNDGLSDNFVIVYRARVLDNVFAQTASAQSLNNTVSISYDTAIATVSNSDLLTAISLTQPVLTVNKSAVTAGGDTVIDPSEVVTYSVDIINSGTAPAYDTVLQDIIPLGMRTSAVTVVSAQLLVAGTVLANPVPSYDAVTGLVIWDLDNGVADSYSIPAGDTLRIVYQTQADAALTGGLTLTNSAQVTNYYSFDDEAVPTLASVTGTREAYAASNIASTTLYTGALPSKALLSAATASIGEEVIYQITVPGTLSTSPLYDLQITDLLDPNLEFVSAAVSGGIGITDNSTSVQMNIGVTEIPAGQQAVIELRTRVRNIVTAQQGVAINNSASYSYAYSAGGTTQPALSTTEIVTVNIIESGLTVNKTVSAITAAPLTGGDILEYVLTVQNSGNATAYDVNIVDTPAAELQLDTGFTPTASINAVAVAGFNANPSGAPAGPLVWGRDNADNSLDIPPAATLVLTYRVLINASTQSNITLSNSAQADWSSLDAASIYERSGAGCPAATAPNDYCSAAAVATITTVDTNTLTKTVIADSYAPTTDATVRIGDSVTYQLSLNLQEGTTRNVIVQDVLPAGLAFVDIVSINGDTVADYTTPASGTGSNFSYATLTSAALPAANQTGTLSFSFGDVVNDPLADATTDSLVIVYRARVTENTLTQQASTTLNNTATLSYVDGTGAAVVDPARLQSSAAVTVQQAVMSSPTKTDSVFTSPANVNVVSDVMHFSLQSCNASGLSPAYNVQLTDLLPSQLDETSLVGPVVTINGVAATAGVDYNYTAPAARGGSMIINLVTPVNPGQCVSVNYDIGFYTDFGPNQSWNNSVTVDEYWSLPSQSGEQYAALGPAIFTMANTAIIPAPAKTMLSPLSAEATIGEEVVYRLTVPSVAVNAALYDVVITDTLHASLEMISASDVSGNGFSLTDNTIANNVSLTIAQIPAGQQAVIELRGRVANNAAANAGTSFSNLVSYSYATTSGGPSIVGGSASTATPLTIIEPALVINKTVLNSTSPGNPPTAGDVLRYSLSFTASGAGAGDSFADAFDLSISDGLSLGLLYQAASTTVNGAGNTITDPVTVGDGVSVAQNLNWNLAAATADIDVVEGSTVTVSYDVVVLDTVQANQVLSNSATAQWTGLDGINANERIGTASPAVNDYVTGPVITTVTTADTNTFTKQVIADSYVPVNDAIVRIGDTVTYQLSLNLQEGTTRNVQVQDVLPAGLAFVDIVSINGDTVADYTAPASGAGSNFSYATVTAASLPAAGQTGSLSFSLGNVVNNPLADATTDSLVIIYRARVTENTLTQLASSTLNNTATLAYVDGSGAAVVDPLRLQSSATVTVQQAVMSTPTKTDSVFTSPANVNIVSDVMHFSLQSCNSGLTPAYNVQLNDLLPTQLDETSIVGPTVTVNGVAATAGVDYNYTAAAARGGNMLFNLITPVNPGQCVTVNYDIGFYTDFGPNLSWNNTVTVDEYWSLPLQSGQQYAASAPTIFSMSNIATIGLPAKTMISPVSGEATVGEQVVYQMTVPAVPVNAALYDVVISDTLDASLEIISATDISGNALSITNNTVGNNLSLTVAQIPAGQTALIELRTRVANNSAANAGDSFSNIVSYSYATTAGGATLPGGSAATPSPLTIIEPLLAINKTVAAITAAPLTGGDILEYVLTIPNSGNATAYDVNIVDTLAAELQLDTGFTPTASINAVAVAGFNANPTGAPAGPLVWGRGNADNSLDIPPGGTLVLTYRVLINASTESNITLSNSAQADWSSLDASSIYERTGAGCPAATAPNDYCSAAAVATITTQDTNTLTKTVIADSYAPVNDATVRIGDSVTYQLSLNLQEGTTRSVFVQDVLPAGLAFVDIVSINGDSVADYSAPASGAGSNFSYAAVTAASLPSSGQTGTLSFNFGNVVNDPLADATTDSLVIEYRVRVTEDTLAPAASASLSNTATLLYIDGSGTPVVDPARLQSSAPVTVWQPVMTAPSKTDSVFTSPANVNIVSDVMHFTLQSCNASGLSPAYNVQLTDVLATQLDETSLLGPVVTINGVAATAGVDYNYTAPAVRGGSMIINLVTPVNPGQCVSVNYDIGFYTDFGPNLSWNNSVTVDEYWSLPLQSGQKYAASAPTIFTMSNLAIIGLPSKVMLSPLSGEATVGEQVVYQMTVPAVPVNAALYDVVISDTLDASLEIISATDISGNALSITNNTAGNNLSLTVAHIPAGQTALIELRTRVANNAAANAGHSFSNVVSYSYATTAGGATLPGGSAATPAPLNIIEPLIAINKTVVNTSSVGNPPTAGDVLRYSLTFSASGGAATDNFADAFDLSITDSLSLGLAYQASSATVGVGNSISDPAIVGDGTASAQTLRWQLSDATADIDVLEGSTVTVTYDVVVLDSVLANQLLSNSATVQWTGLDGINANERNGSATPAVNDYVTAPVITTLTTPDTTTFSKLRINDTYGAGDANVRVGDLIDYELRVGLQEGQHNNVIISDSLPQGLAFETVVHINGDSSPAYNAVAPFVHAAITPVVSGDPATGPSTVSFTLGNIINVGDNNAANDEFVIVYRARVLDNVFAQTNSTTLTNNVQLDYTTATGATLKTAAASSTLLQPDLSVTKLAAAAGGDTIIDAGELVTYTVDVINSGTAPAYDVLVQDLIPFGMRNGSATITMLSTTLVNAGTALLNPTPAYDAITGIASWNLDTGAANTYTIPANETLRIVYQLQADADLGAGLTLTNAVQVTNYYSFDDEAVPTLGASNGVRQSYGPTNIASTTHTSPAPGALLKQNPAELTVSVGESFTYRITVPATPIQTALHDVRVLDDLNASAADLTFVSVSKISGSQPWTPVNSGTSKNLIIEDTTAGIDIPAGEQVIIDITVQVDNTATNVSGLLFNNTASYSYNQLANNPASQQTGAASTTTDMTIVGPDNLTLEKTGPAQMRIGIPATFSLNIHNTGTAAAWDISIVDVLPNPTPGGMCDTAPVNITAQTFLADGVTAVSAPLLQGTDFVASYLPAPDCTLTITMQSAAAAVAADNRLIVTYQAQLDADNVHGVDLTNLAAVTQWFSGDTAGAGATGAIRTYSRTLTDGTSAVLDHEDAHTLVTELPIVSVLKSVSNVTTGQNPGSNASPGDRLRYSILIQNVSPVELTNFSFVDELDGLNVMPAFAAGSLNLTTVPAGADSSNSNASGGAKGTGLLDIRNLNLGAAGSTSETVLLEFEVTLAPVITSGSVVLNQGQLTATNLTLLTDDPVINGADDPNLLGDEDPTQTLIASTPLFEVFKTSQDMSGDPTELQAGDTLRYTITVKNIGSENAINAILRDQLPANTIYTAGSTTLNGAAVADISAGVLPLANGIVINAIEDTTPGAMRADATATTANVATVTFDVVIDNTVVSGTVISNQAFFNADGAGSGFMPEKASDDPATATADDPTLNVIGNLPLLDAVKTVSIVVDNGAPGSLDPGDVIRYSITINNIGAKAATAVTFTDNVPANTTYVADSVMQNGLPLGQPDGGVSPLIAGIDVSSSDLTPALPTAGNGIISAGASAVISFDVQLDAATPIGTIISNQGSVDSLELPIELTDADGVDSNGDQPTLIVVGNAQLVSIVKSVSVVGGGAALAGGQLEYRIVVSNISSVPATNVTITDNLDLPVAGQLSYVNGSGLLNGLATGVSHTAPVVTADYAAAYGDLAPGQSAELVFRASINNALAIGTTIDNTADVSWNADTQNANASIAIDVGGTPGVANVNGKLWHDANFNNSFDGSEIVLSGWSVDIYRNTTLLGTVTTDANGDYSINGLIPNDIGADRYDIRFRAPGSNTTTAKLGLANSDPALGYSDALQRIYNIVVSSGTSIQNLNLPIDPNGVVYNSVLRTPVAGASVSLLNAATGVAISAACFDDVNQQNQLTTANGYYKFDLNFSQADCIAASDYLIQYTPPATGYSTAASVVITPLTDATTTALDVANCPAGAADAIAATANICEATASAVSPALSAAPMSAGTNYYLNLTLNNAALPDDSQLFNNHLPVDPILTNAVNISKTTSLFNVTRSQLVPYTITVKNGLPIILSNSNVIDNYPAGFKYVKGSARLNGVAREPVQNGLQLSWSNIDLIPNETQTFELLLIAGSAVSEGEYINKAYVIDTLTNTAASGIATASVRVISDPVFDCSDVIGKVFDDKNLNNYQDENESGLAGVRVVTARGLVVTSDKDGRFHLTCAVVPNESRGSNFILKLDDRSLPAGYRVTTENPRVQRATRGKMMNFNFAATVHRVVSMDLLNDVFIKDSIEVHSLWKGRLDLLIDQLKDKPSVLRLSYLADIEDSGLVNDRLKKVKMEITERWNKVNDYVLNIETEIFWRRGGPR